MVILGQDPYHGPNQAHGLCFSVRHGVRTPPSLVNIHKELASDLGVPIPTHGNLEKWARQGVLLLNTTLTVRAGQAGSHQGHGWETFTDQVIRTVTTRSERVVFILWGSHARKKKELIDTDPPHDHRVGAPVAAVGAQRVLRDQAVQPHQRRAARRRAGTDRLGPVDRRRRSARGATR